MVNQTGRSFTALLIAIIACASCAPTPTNTPASVIAEPFDSQIALVYGPGGSSTMLGGSAFGDLAIPELVVYEDGLVLFSCPKEAVQICQHEVAPERVVQLLDDLSALGFFDDSWHFYMQAARLGPHTEYFMIAPNPTNRSQTSKMSWTTASYDGDWSQAPGILGPTLTLVNEFKREVSPSKQLYQPKYAALWITVYDGCPLDHSRWCNDPGSTPAWPFDFDPHIQIDDPKCSKIEVPQAISDIEIAIPNFYRHPVGETYGFIDGANLVLVTVRPYLPDEEMPTRCVSDRWWYFHPAYDTLLTPVPGSELPRDPDLPIPTPTNSFHVHIPKTDIEVIPAVERIEPTVVQIVEDPISAPTVNPDPVRYVGEDHTNDLAVDKTGRIWSVGTHGVVRWNLADRTYTRFTTEHGLASNSVEAVAIARDGALWFGTSMGSWLGDGVSRYDGATWTTYTEKQGLISNHVDSIAVAQDGAIWFGGHTGVSRFDGETWTNYNLWALLDGIPIVYDIEVAPDGSLWFGTDSGVARFDGEKWTAYSNLEHQTILSIASEPKGTVWFASWFEGGLSRFDGTTWATYRFAPDDGRMHNWARCVAVAPDGTVWVGTQTYVFRFDGETWYAYDMLIESIAVAPDGALWFAGYTGKLFSFDGEGWTQYQIMDE